MHPVTQLFDLIEGPIRYGLVQWAFEKGVFDQCEQPVTAEELADGLGLIPTNTERALQALTACGFLVAKNARFRVDAAFAPYALRSSPKCFAQTFLDLGHTRHAGLAELSRLIDGRSCDAPPVTFDADHWCKQQRSLATFHKSVAAHEMVRALHHLPEWPSVRTILDVGGGSLELGETILTEKPDAHVMLFDIAPLVAALDPEDSVSLDICAGNYNEETSLPDGPFDLIWCSMSLYFACELEQVLKALKKRLSPGGVLVSFHEDLTEDRCAPSRHVVGRTMPALHGKDLSFANGAIATAFRSSGLKGITSDLIETPFGPFRLDAGRKRFP